jgi:hypothetical protein
MGREIGRETGRETGRELVEGAVKPEATLAPAAAAPEIMAAAE